MGKTQQRTATTHAPTTSHHSIWRHQADWAGRVLWAVVPCTHIPVHTHILVHTHTYRYTHACAHAHPRAARSGEPHSVVVHMDQCCYCLTPVAATAGEVVAGAGVEAGVHLSVICGSSSCCWFWIRRSSRALHTCRQAAAGRHRIINSG